mmetsp:Transcript_46499/g.133028  ORF Transcript_46499/g.133028 Transcript_46499/m.133028 type:complete len:341 (-) Transcript_46499:230-1252(-)
MDPIFCSRPPFTPRDSTTLSVRLRTSPWMTLNCERSRSLPCFSDALACRSSSERAPLRASCRDSRSSSACRAATAAPSSARCSPRACFWAAVATNCPERRATSPWMSARCSRSVRLPVSAAATSRSSAPTSARPSASWPSRLARKPTREATLASRVSCRARASALLCRKTSRRAPPSTTFCVNLPTSPWMTTLASSNNVLVRSASPSSLESRSTCILTSSRWAASSAFSSSSMPSSTAVPTTSAASVWMSSSSCSFSLPMSTTFWVRLWISPRMTGRVWVSLSMSPCAPSKRPSRAPRRDSAARALATAAFRRLLCSQVLPSISACMRSSSAESLPLTSA